MKALKKIMLSGTLLVCTAAVFAQNAEDILQKHIAAIGGTDKWNSIKSMKLVGTMSVGGMEMGMTQTVVTDKAMRMDISAMGMTGYTIITQKGGWMYIPFQPGMDKVTPIPEEQVKASQSKLNIKGGYLVDRSAIKSAEYIGLDTVNNMPCYKLKIVDNDGNEQKADFDMSTYYLVRSEGVIKVQDQETEMAATFSNFKKLPEGIVMPMSLNAGQGDVTFTSVELNKPIDESIFVPSDPKAETTPAPKPATESGADKK